MWTSLLQGTRTTFNQSLPVDEVPRGTEARTAGHRGRLLPLWRHWWWRGYRNLTSLVWRSYSPARLRGLERTQVAVRCVPPCNKKYTRSVLFWDFTQCRLVVGYRRCEISYSRLQGSKSFGHPQMLYTAFYYITRHYCIFWGTFNVKYFE